MLGGIKTLKHNMMRTLPRL